MSRRGGRASGGQSGGGRATGWALPGLALALALGACPAGAVTLEVRGPVVLALERSEPLGRHAIATGPWAEDGGAPVLAAEGAVTRRVWQVNAAGRTVLQILAPLREQVAAQGFRPLLDCEAEACGGFDFRAAVEILPPPAMFVDLVDFHYLSARRGGEVLSLLVSRSDAQGFVQLVAVAPADPTDPVPPAAPEAGPAPAASDLAARIEGEGRVVLEGLAFASGGAELGPDGGAALAALAAYLAANPGRRVAIVGHTDAEGSLAANVALSKRRAEAVADRLVALGVGRGRLVAEGMGWLAPRATNLTAEGRAANRRVEALVLP
ncbi:OmpA family protein [Rubellimicrobium aerolatum]|uniref:OmpA family protein n=1 Tax=Rubellimicrobium aerolatum TaxID=490979 RepID=A0ABW0S9L1_9RHOB|nr:OmpA family protein [Rubellimicrobium aerolatum]MBP1804996.1 OOP family OmpA-OmpF porin [Rubellimicrobium aerolatum]